jgi:chromosome segregation ATPase
MNTLLITIFSVIFGGGLLAAIVKAFSALTQERQFFVKELNEVRDRMSKLYQNQYQLQEENSKLKIKIAELEAHVNYKSEIINKLKEYIKTYKEADHAHASANLIEQVIELVD